MPETRLYYRSWRFISRWFVTLLFRARVYGQQGVPRQGGVLLGRFFGFAWGFGMTARLVT